MHIALKDLLDELVVADVFEGIFEGHLAHRREVESIVGADGAGVGELWRSGNPVPIQKRFNKNLNIYHVQSVLAGYVLG